jgi:F-type H+-transporting ATPase subunit a
MRAPTADLSTTAALAIVVFLAVPVYGIRARGLWGYLRHYLEPSPLLLPVEIITEFSRTLALAVRLFGNVMSEELIIAVLLSLAGLLTPTPIMMLAVLTGIVQAYIFSVLTMVYLSAAVRAEKTPST